MLKVNVLAVATAAALFAFGGAIAQSSSSTAATPSFSAIDKNNDGQISRQEWSEYERTAKPAAGVRSDKEPTATTGPQRRRRHRQGAEPWPCGRHQRLALRQQRCRSRGRHLARQHDRAGDQHDRAGGQHGRSLQHGQGPDGSHRAEGSRRYQVTSR